MPTDANDTKRRLFTDHTSCAGDATKKRPAANTRTLRKTEVSSAYGCGLHFPKHAPKILTRTWMVPLEPRKRKGTEKNGRVGFQFCLFKGPKSPWSLSVAHVVRLTTLTRQPLHFTRLGNLFCLKTFHMAFCELHDIPHLSLYCVGTPYSG